VSRGLGDVYKRQNELRLNSDKIMANSFIV
jgi:hypothetical protein